ncbi:hypothetical protein GQ457_14G021010 [Hibiscus cannabinus]
MIADSLAKLTSHDNFEVISYYAPPYSVKKKAAGCLGKSVDHRLLKSSRNGTFGNQREFHSQIQWRDGSRHNDKHIVEYLSYFLVSSSLIYTQILNQGFPEPSIDLKYPGIVLFLIGIGGNFYHHYLLSKLRTKGDKDYKIPKGGLFELVIFPHYLFEILGFFGISLISQTFYSFLVTLGCALYLMCRSYVTRRWYISMFDDFPNKVKALIPYVF